MSRMPLVALFCVTLIVPASLDAQASTPAADPTSALPLEPSRTIRFTTDEGTWMSIDVSTDGRSLLFDMIGDLYTLPISGGKATAITRGVGYDMQPRWSPDGRRIVFISDRDGDYGVWIANADGTTPRKVSKGEYHRFLSPFWQDENHIIVGQIDARSKPTKGYELRIYDTETGEFEPIEGAPRGEDAKPIESASASLTTDGRFLYYSPWTAGETSSWHLTRLDRNTGEVLTFSSRFIGGRGGAMRPVVSPDGKAIVYASEFDAQTGFRIRDTKTGDEAWLAYPVQRSQHARATYGVVPGYDFTPDGRALIAAWGGKIRRIDLATKNVSIIPFEAEVEQPIGPSTRFAARVDDGPTVRARVIQGTELSPDGKRAAFSALARIYIGDLATGRTRRLTSSDEYEFQPDWSPDGQWITYVTWGMNGGALMKARADGTGEPVRLAPAGPFYRDPVWSPDGSAVLALRAPKQERQRMNGDWFPWYVPPSQQLIEVSGSGGSGDPTVLAEGADLWNPQLNAAGDRIIALSARSPRATDGQQTSNLVSLARDGSDRRIEMRIRSWAPSSARASRGARIARSPDGAHLLATIEDVLYLIEVGEVEPDSTGVKYLDMEKARSTLTKLDVSGADWVTWTDGGATLVWTRGATVLRQPLAATVRGVPAGVHGQVEAARDSIVLTAEIPRSRPCGTVVLSGARIITMRGDEVLPAGDIVVTDNRIATVGPSGQVSVPPDASVIDLNGKTIMPGLVDTHVHWNSNLHDVLEIPAWPMVAGLAYGVTSGFDPNPELADMMVYHDLIDAGEFPGPRAFSTGPAMTVQRFVESRADAAALMYRYRNNYGLDFVKSYVMGNRKQRQYVVQGARDVGIMPTAEGGFDFVMNMTHAIDGMAGHEHHIPIYPIFRDVIQLWVQSGISYSPTPTTAWGGGRAEDYFEARADFHDNEKIGRFWPHWRVDRSRRARSTELVEEYDFIPLTESAVKILKAGGNVATGSHQPNYGPGEHFQLWTLVMAGASPLEAIRAGTINGARHIGYADDLGSIEVGKLADLIVLDRNPLENIENTLSVRYVMTNGELFDGATMNRIWPSAEELTPMWFWEEDPVLSRTR